MIFLAIPLHYWALLVFGSFADGLAIRACISSIRAKRNDTEWSPVEQEWNDAQRGGAMAALYAYNVAMGYNAYIKLADGWNSLETFDKAILFFAPLALVMMGQWLVRLSIARRNVLREAATPTGMATEEAIGGEVEKGSLAP